MSITTPVSINPFNMKKSDLVKYMTGRCRHRHKYIEHPNCFLKEQGRNLRIGYLDIETTDLVADIGVMLTWAIKTRDADKHDMPEYFTGRITKEELFEQKFDKRLCEELIKALEQYDIILTYFGTRFDVPFIRSRCLYWKLPFPTFGYVKHKDVYYMVKRLLKLRNNRLETATKFLGIAGKNHVELDIWRAARYGDKKALDYVYDHNIRDVDILEALHKKLEMYDKGLSKSI